MINLNREINLNKKFILILVLVCILSMGLYSSYAYFQISVIKNNVVVIQTASISVTTEVVSSENQTFTLNQGETKTITVNLSSSAVGDIGYKMYYDVVSGVSAFLVTSTETFTDAIVEGVMNATKTITFTFQNTGSNASTIKLGTQGGLKGYPISLEQGGELVLNKELGVPVKSAITSSIANAPTSCKTNIVEDGITYILGSSACINFNYLWYSGKLWRITAIYPNGTVKMITDDTITSISYGSDINFYTNENTKSYIYQWLNEDFLDTLYNYENILVTDSKWNIAKTGSISTKPETENIVTAPVGLLNSYEYYMSIKNITSSSSYLNIGYGWWLLNPYSLSIVWYVGDSGSNRFDSSLNTAYGVRPSINLKSTIQLIGGTGTKEDPYKILGDKEEVTANTTLLNTRISGEYVKFDGELYRIVSIENGKTKLNKNDYIKDATGAVVRKYFSSNLAFGGGTDDTYFDYYLNNTWYKNISETYKKMLVEGTYYLGPASTGYKGAICKTANNTITTKDCEKTTSIWMGLVGLLRYGEMFAGQQGSGSSTSSSMWLMSPYFDSTIVTIGSDNWYRYGYNYTNYDEPNTKKYTVRPSINLKSTIKITGGEGTKESPFEISE